jgi:hypothetical protein
MIPETITARRLSTKRVVPLVVSQITAPKMALIITGTSSSIKRSSS